MSSALITVTELSVKPAEAEAAAAAWLAHHAASGFEGRVLYRGLEDSTLLELAPLAGYEQIESLRKDWRELWDVVGPMAESDFSRQLLHFVEAPKPSADPLPDTAYIQMRHVEVPPTAYRAYRAWREETIFDVVRNAPEVDYFEAYHSVLSSEPGVMFVSGFSCEPKDYTAVFTSPRYQEIVRQAGDSYITGGDRGLYTRLYARLTPAA
ncbi:hypothetical protein ACFXKJ_13160 [Kitasatospora indigofera]|uniref:Uncharacterized protein n=1 Tax=Kitasatospora indigofera TaxID=67307 RepID=A0A919L4S8_9ACTN|nr:hypothetical protein [Kitasatospora indigofera]GHH83787.1 hypothetical protein GCM10018781_71720 [Kitasatospora indigofera]